MTEDGVMVAEVTATDDEEKVKLILHKGSTVKNSQGQKITSVRIKKSVESHAVNGNSAIVSPAYDIQPIGAIFTPGATLLFKYADAQLTGNVHENNLYLALWDPAAGAWTDFGGDIDPAANTVSVPIEHLSVYALMAHTAPAHFELSDLHISSKTTAPGEVIDISVLVTNTGDLSGSYELNLKLDDVIVGTEAVTLDGGASETVHFEVTASGLGEHEVAAGALTDTFTVEENLLPADFTVTDLFITPEEIYPGDNVSISIRVSNTGDLTGTHHTALLINGAEIEAMDVTLVGGQSRVVVFNTVAGASGVYNVSVDDLHSVFSVLVTPPPTLIGTAGPEISGFTVTPAYNNRGRLAAVMLEYRLDVPEEQTSGTSLALRVLYEGSLLEQVPVFLPDDGQSHTGSGSLTYAPTQGWKPGIYSFRLELYSGDVLTAVSFPEQLSVAKEDVAAVVSWKTLGIIIGASLMLAAIAIIAILIRRRDMLHG